MITTQLHPSLITGFEDWQKWRLAYQADELFRDHYLKKFSARESDDEFKTRKSLTPIPSFAKTAINEIRNAVFQRMRDISRIGGSESYRRALNGLDRGVDRCGSTMNAFIGTKLLTEMLVMGKVGVFIDAPTLSSNTVADAQNSRPYLYCYTVEDILSWSYMDPQEPSKLHALLLRETYLSYDQRTLLPKTTPEIRYRHLWIGDDGFVRLQFLDKNSEPDGDVITLELERIPFVMVDIGDSLIQNAADYQIALMNLASTDVWYALKANFPFYVEQFDPRAAGSHLKRVPTEDGTASSGGQGAADQDIRVGTTQGRRYPSGMDAPEFIHPSPEPLQASMSLQTKYEQDIRKLVHLAIVAMATRASAESKALDNESLNAGLSFIGLVLESAEREIAEHWAAYEQRNIANRKIPTIRYPERYSLKTEDERIDEADRLSKLTFTIPSRTAKRELSKTVVNTLLNGKVPVETITQIESEIDGSDYLTSDPDVILQACEKGLVGEQTASVSLGFSDDEYLTAREDHAARVARIQAAQSPNNVSEQRPAARGVDDLDADPESGREEREQASDPDSQYDRRPPVRGEGQ